MSNAQHEHAPLWRTLLAFAAIYFIWGSTFYAIRVGVLAVPPILFAAMRFFAAGVLLFAWQMLRGAKWPTAKEWQGITIVALIIFVGNYGLLFWAEARVPSGLASVVISTIALFIAMGEVFILQTRRLTAKLLTALLLGLTGVAVLSLRLGAPGEAPITFIGACALLGSALCFALGSIVSRKVTLPASKGVSSGAQMLVGSVQLLIAAALGNLRGFSLFALPANVLWWWAYLVFAGSIAGFTAYVWLLARESPTKVGTYAYVNPMVAVILGHFVGGEPWSIRTLIGGVFVLGSVILVTTAKASKPPAIAAEAEA
ncbi:EamA family transporter [Granulicella cerasi]|uniref:EamA family transporter n=1 Tax=Granulicella cerasi TaxID=741063 RepID=A0ABW1Z7B6_9BACT